MSDTYKIMGNSHITIPYRIDDNVTHCIFYLKNGVIEFAPYFPSAIEKGQIYALRKIQHRKRPSVVQDEIGLPKFMMEAAGLKIGDYIKLVYKTNQRFAIIKAQRSDEE